MPPQSEQGQTLMEMLVVLGLMALLASLAFPELRKPLARMQLTQAGAELAGRLRGARAQAVRSGDIVRVAVADNGRAYAVEDRQYDLPDALTVGEPGELVTFYPDGGSSGGDIAIGTGRLTRVVRVDPFTGVVATVR